MSKENYLDMIIEFLESYKNFYFSKWQEKYIILNKKFNNETIEQKFGNVTYYSKFNDNNTGDNYELIVFDDSIGYDVAHAFFKLIIFTSSELPKTLENINKIFTQIKVEMSLSEKRGIFAELHSIIFDNLKPRVHKNSIYDMIDEKGNDVEIKSYSKVKRSIILSYRQLTDNNEAKIFAYEVIESSKGNSLYDLYLKLPLAYKDRYNYLEFFKDDQDKFVISNDSKVCIFIKDVNKNIVLPDGCSDANYIFNIDHFSKKCFKST